MPNDAKLGLVVGVGLILAVAVVFFRKDAADGDTADTNVKTVLPAAGRGRPAVAQAMGRALPAKPAEPPGRQHTVRDGETLFSLAQHYYGDGEHFHLISRANHQDGKPTEPLPPGTVLVIPEAPETTSVTDEP